MRTDGIRRMVGRNPLLEEALKRMHVAWQLVLLGIVMLALFTFLLIFVRRKLDERSLELIKQLGNEGIVRVCSKANFFGQESRGLSQVRGNGVLLLTRQTIHFELLVPRRTWSIPLERLTGLETPRHHLGRSQLRRLLKLRYVLEDGRPDSVAWLVSELEEWLVPLQEMLARRDHKRG